MRFEYHYQKEVPQLLRSFLKEQGISKGLLAKVKFQGGHILVNGQEENVLYSLKWGDQVTFIIPDEGEHETMLPSEGPVDIVFEDEHVLVVNKPAGIASIPAQYHPTGTLANRVKAYYLRQGYADQVIHIVTRLDRDTSGLMVFAKHGFAHAKMDKQLRAHQFLKKYQALVGGAVSRLQDHEMIDRPISRQRTSLMQRMVDPAGQPAQTEYWLEQRDLQQAEALVDIQLHTGRTHQIRVHFADLGCPLLGDDMYGGSLTRISRQALHCYELQFAHPFTGELLHFIQEPPADMAELIAKMRN
ncbi:RluA family pseudouridine synthase [Enterococcus diestrammenae]|uniref:RluA family pseudouridine synthase n=1 Tax=Enterococcus diestrammenae TaxID=1155073 RepID=UPI00195D1454